MSFVSMAHVSAVRPVCVRRYQRQLKDMKEQVKEAEAREQEMTKKKRMAVSSSCPHTFPLTSIVRNELRIAIHTYSRLVIYVYSICWIYV